MSCTNNNGNFNETIILEPSGEDVIVITACTGVITNHLYSCSGDSEIHLTSGATVFTQSIEPEVDNSISVGTQFKRFRDLNTFSGSSTYWSSTTISTTSIDLGLDSLGNSRILTADSSVMQNDTLNGGIF